MKHALTASTHSCGLSTALYATTQKQVCSSNGSKHDITTYQLQCPKKDTVHCLWCYFLFWLHNRPKDRRVLMSLTCRWWMGRPALLTPQLCVSKGSASRQAAMASWTPTGSLTSAVCVAGTTRAARRCQECLPNPRECSSIDCA